MRSKISLFTLMIGSQAMAMGSPAAQRSCAIGPFQKSLAGIVAKRVPRGSNGRGAAASILRVSSSGQVLEVGFEKNAHNFQAVASTQKVMTAWVTVQHGPSLGKTLRYIEDDVFYDEQGKRAINYKNQIIQPGGSATTGEFLKTLLVQSSNGAAQALARGSSGSVQKFVQLMNDEAYRILGATRRTYFQNPSGLTDDDNRYRFAGTNGRQGSTAREMAQLVGKIMASSSFRSKVGSAGVPYAKDGAFYKLGLTDAAGRTVVMRFPHPTPGCEKEGIAAAFFGENSSAQFGNFEKAMAEIKALLR